MRLNHNNTKPRKRLIIFDIDGTLCDTHEVDDRCYIEAIESVTGHSLSSADWSHYPEATSAAIVHDLLSAQGVSDIAAMEELITAEFAARLDAEARRKPELFKPVEGALELFYDLKDSVDHKIAIATGCWRESARLKLRRSSFLIEDIPFASSSDTQRRADIIALAAHRAGCTVNDAIYVGDGLWDLKACQELNMPFVGVGRKHGLLRKHGASRVFVSFAERSSFFGMLREEN